MLMNECQVTDEEFTSAIEMLRHIVPEQELNAIQPTNPGAVYTTMITLWMLILQRLGGGTSMSSVVKEVLSKNADLLPQCKRTEEGTLSVNSGAYCRARKRLAVNTVELFVERICRSLIDSTSPWFGGRRAFLLDGTTMTLAPTDELREAFPPINNGHGSVWPVALMLVAHELQSGCALIPEIGAMYGDHNTSEAKLTKKLCKRIPPGSIILADSGFGIFSVAYHTVNSGHDILFRLTKQRFNSLVKKSELISKTDGAAMYELTWTPTPKDRKSNPELPGDAKLEVALHEIPIEGDTLYLVTTLALSSEQAGDFYSYRYDVEHDIRDIKVVLDTENIRAKSVDMFKKELLTSIVAYNLVIQFRRQAAELVDLPPRRLSFKGVWTTFRCYLLDQSPCSLAAWEQRYEKALHVAARDKLPNRPGRSYPRRAHPKRQKSTKFMKLEAKAKRKLADGLRPEKRK